MPFAAISADARVRRTRARFVRQVEQVQKEFKQNIRSFLRTASVASLLTTPIIYSVALPLAMLDLWVSVYQRICFPIYGITRVRRASYFSIDRHKLAYLNVIEKANCMYCSYANGVIAYVREVTARTEHYWCPIKHARRAPGAHAHYQLFFEYGDARGYRRGLPALRRVLRDPPRRRRRAVVAPR